MRSPCARMSDHHGTFFLRDRSFTVTTMKSRRAYEAKRVSLIGVAIASYVVLCGNRSDCDNLRTPTLVCDQQLDLLVQPGTCVEITNPCDDHQWNNPPRIDGFRLCRDTDDGEPV